MDIGKRIKLERERLKYNQTDFAAIAGASKNAQIKWEKGSAFPNAYVLSAWSKVGVDATFIISGKRQLSEFELDDVFENLGRSFAQIFNISADEISILISEVAKVMQGKKPDENNFDKEVKLYLVELKNQYLLAVEQMLERKNIAYIEKFILFQMIANLEFALITKELQLTPENKADTVLDLYSSVRAIGGYRVEYKMVENSITAAIERQKS